MTLIDKDFEFHEVVSKVEERFRKVYDGEKVAAAQVESQMEPDMISTGWWVVLSRFGIAIRFGDMKPDIAAGDTLILVAHVQKKKPDAPALAVVPPAPPPIDAEVARKVWLDHLATLPIEERTRFAEAISALPAYTP